METPLQITFKDFDSSEAIENAVREKVGKLERYCESIIRCQVVIECAHRHQSKGRLYTVRINLHVPGKEIVVNRTPAEHGAHEDIFVALVDSFDTAARQVEEYSRRRRGEEKPHRELPHGKVARLFTDEGYGFIETVAGYDVYFHENSVQKNGFKQLEVGDVVAFVEEEGEKGPQASAVKPLR